MATGFDVKDWAENIYKVHEAVRIAIVPPWRIEDVDGHPAVNLGSLVVATGLYLILRLFTPSGDFGVSETGVLIALVLIFLFACGVLVNFFHPGADAAKLSNRWSTFTIVMFFYSIVMLILMSFIVPVVTGHNLYDWLASPAMFKSDRAAWSVATLFATLLAGSLLYWRTFWWFGNILKERPSFLFSAFAFCILVNWGILFVLLFVI
jgi:hypothetical protein